VRTIGIIPAELDRVSAGAFHRCANERGRRAELDDRHRFNSPVDPATQRRLTRQRSVSWPDDRYG
jgi:hypothetical protein